MSPAAALRLSPRGVSMLMAKVRAIGADGDVGVWEQIADDATRAQLIRAVFDHDMDYYLGMCAELWCAAVAKAGGVPGAASLMNEWLWEVDL